MTEGENEREHSVLRVRLGRREFLKRTGIVLAGSSLSGFLLPHATHAASGSSDLVIWNPDPFEDWLGGLASVSKTFEMENPGVKVQIVQVPFSDLPTKVLASHATNTLPDIIYTTDRFITDWGAQGITQPLDDVLERIGKSKFYPNLLKYTVYQTRAYAIPVVAYPHIVFYRKDWYAEAGLKPPMTWDSMLANARALHNPSQNRYGWLVFNKYPDITVFNSLMATNNAFEFDKDGRVAINSAQTVEALQAVKALAELSPPGSATKSQQEMRLVFAQGIGAHMMTSTSMVDVLAQNPALVDKVSAFFLPVNKGDRGAVTGFVSWTVTKASKNAALAKKFLETWFRPDVAVKLAQDGVRGYLPIERAVAVDPRYRSAPRIKPFIAFIAAGEKVLQTGVLLGQRFGPNPDVGKVAAARIWTQMMDKVVVEGQDPKVVAAWAEKAIQDAIK